MRLPHTSFPRSLRLPVPLLLAAAMLGGCRSTPPRAVGADLPVVPASSRALPGSVNSADAPEAPRVQTNRREVTSFRDAETGLAFNYPTDWRPLSAAGPMPPPMFTQTLGAAQGTQAFLPAGTRFANTNLVGISFGWTVKRHAHADACGRASITGLPAEQSLPPETISGQSFARASGSEGQACHQRMGIVDAALRDGHCYVFERDVETVCPGIPSAGNGTALTDAQKAELQGELDQVMASVRLQ